MSDDLRESSLVLRREALLPNERSRGLGTVAVVCTMAGVASGLALATTLMAMQVADTMTMRGGCPYHEQAALYIARPDRGFLGVSHKFVSGADEIKDVLPGTPASAIGLKEGDRVLAINGERLDYPGELEQIIGSAGPGAQPSLTIERDGTFLTLRPTLALAPDR
jgi:S1-C subfamily serine protease